MVGLKPPNKDLTKKFSWILINSVVGEVASYVNVSVVIIIYNICSVNTVTVYSTIIVYAGYNFYLLLFSHFLLLTGHCVIVIDILA